MCDTHAEAHCVSQFKILVDDFQFPVEDTNLDKKEENLLNN